MPAIPFSLKTMESLQNGVATHFEGADKNICHYSKIARTCHLLSKRSACYLSASKTHVRDRIFKLYPIHASVTYQISWICWIRWIPFPFRENSIDSIRPVSQASSQHCRSIDTDAQCKRALTVIFLLITRSDPETGEQYSELTFSIHIRRNPIFYNMLIVKPGVLLGVMPMPPSATDRYSYGM